MLTGTHSFKDIVAVCVRRSWVHPFNGWPQASLPKLGGSAKYATVTLDEVQTSRAMEAPRAPCSLTPKPLVARLQ